MSTVLVQAGRYGGFVHVPRQAAPQLSERARALGLHTREDVEREYADQVDYHGGMGGWSNGNANDGELIYHCPFCDADFCSPSGARKHMRTQNHPVLRVDWYGAEGREQ